MANAPHDLPHRMNRFGDSTRNLLRITTVRVIVQTVMFALFLSFVLLTSFAQLDRHPGLRLWIDKVLEIDPLVALATALSTHTLYRGLIWSLVILIPTLFLGRFFCGWICPFGAMNQFIAWLFNRRTGQQLREANRYRPIYALKYYLLTGLLLAAALGSLQIGLLDPICLIYRSFTTALLPAAAAAAPTPTILGADRLYQSGGLIGVIVLVFVAAGLLIPRLFCRAICPLGALLGVLSRFAWWRIDRDPTACNNCNRCSFHCEGACDPQGQIRKSECFVCFNCIEECPESGLSFRFLPSPDREVAAPDISRRKLVFAAVSGALLYPFARVSGRVTRNFSARVIRPPGAVEELEFLERCLKCGQCLRVCPTNVLQPAELEAGFEGLWSPLMNYRLGFCQTHCTACGHACPTGAIQRLTVDRKLGQGPDAARGPVRLGTAHFDVGRCLPHSKNVPCVVCQEVCPTSPKAIYTVRQTHTTPDGKTIELQLPYIDLDRCIGCGMCEYACPVVGDRRAVHVTPEGETRSQFEDDAARNRSIRLAR